MTAASSRTDKRREPTRPFTASAIRENPVWLVADQARTIVCNAIDKGWAGPSFDLLQLADLMNIPAVARRDLVARQLVSKSRSRLEYNPSHLSVQARQSIAIELAKAVFCESGDRPTHQIPGNRAKADRTADELAHVAASQFLMPIGSVPELEGELSIGTLARIAESSGVPVVMALLRFVQMSQLQCAAFVASKRSTGKARGRFAIDYVINANGWRSGLVAGGATPKDSIVDSVTPESTAQSDEHWGRRASLVHIECIGISPLLSCGHSRVAGILRPHDRMNIATHGIQFLKGDATQPSCDGNRVIAHVVNDKASTWGGGFARVVRSTFPAAQDDFRKWATSLPREFKLGNSRLSAVSKNLSVFSMISQHGFGASEKPRIRYKALRACLLALSKAATDLKASVHMPRIACGQAGGSWNVVRELINEALCSRGISVTVYDLP